MHVGMREHISFVDVCGYPSLMPVTSVAMMSLFSLLINLIATNRRLILELKKFPTTTEYMEQMTTLRGNN